MQKLTSTAVPPIQAICPLKQRERDIERNQKAVSFRFLFRGFWTVRFRDSTHIMNIVRKTISLPALLRGCHLITGKILLKFLELPQFRVGHLNIFLQHTSVSITINENCSAGVCFDLESSMNAIVPEGASGSTHPRAAII
jgi:hypothetical protein